MAGSFRWEPNHDERSIKRPLLDETRTTHSLTSEPLVRGSTLDLYRLQASAKWTKNLSEGNGEQRFKGEKSVVDREG